MNSIFANDTFYEINQLTNPKPDTITTVFVEHTQLLTLLPSVPFALTDFQENSKEIYEKWGH